METILPPASARCPDTVWPIPAAQAGLFGEKLPTRHKAGNSAFKNIPLSRTHPASPHFGRDVTEFPTARSGFIVDKVGRHCRPGTQDGEMLDRLSGRTGRNPAAGRSAKSFPSDPSGGLAAGTLVATPEGWLPIESIRVGDGVVTFDDGIQAVAGVSRRLHGVRPAEKRGPRPLLSVPAGLIGNRRPLVVDQGQGVMVESDLAQTILRDQFALVEAAALSRLPPIRKVLPEAPTVMVTLGFEEPQMIFAEGRALMLCPADDLLNPMTLEAAMRAGLNARYQLLPRATAEMIVASIGMKQRLSHWRSNLKPDPSYA